MAFVAGFAILLRGSTYLSEAKALQRRGGMPEIPEELEVWSHRPERSVGRMSPGGPAAGRGGGGFIRLPERKKVTALAMTFLSGGSRIRTGDPMLAKHVLYQLSYTPGK